MASLKLKKAAALALKENMGVTDDETLLVLTDEPMREIGEAFFEAGQGIARECLYCEITPRQANGQEPPEPIAELMKAVDVVIAPTSRSLTHTNARREASKQGVRIGTMPGINQESLIRCLSADYEEIIQTNERLTTILKNTSEIRVTTKLGTNLTMQIRGRRILSSTGELRTIGESGNIPSGEVYCAPHEGKTNGVVVFDGSIAGIGMLDGPVTVEINDGFAEVFTGKSTQAKVFEKMLQDVGKYARAVAEFGIGTNPKARVSGDILEDEKVLGTIHVAFGNNLSMGGKINVPIHLDGIVTKPTVYADDEKIIAAGKLVLD